MFLEKSKAFAVTPRAGQGAGTLPASSSSGKDYRAYLMSKNKQNTNNLNTYKTKYESAIGKITPEEAEKQLELNDNLIDEEQVSNELRDLIRKFVPNVQYLDKALTDSR